MVREVVVLSGARTPIGGYGGSLKDIPPSELGAQCVREAVRRAGIELVGNPDNLRQVQRPAIKCLSGDDPNYPGRLKR